MSIEASDAADKSFVAQVAQEAEAELARKKQQAYVAASAHYVIVFGREGPFHSLTLLLLALRRFLLSLLANGSGSAQTSAVVEYKKQTETAAQFGTSALIRRRATEVPKPKWHAPWKLKRVISGHLGWVRAVAVDPTNDWFVTGSADRTIKVRCIDRRACSRSLAVD